MDGITVGISSKLFSESQAQEDQVHELTELQLAIVGGGIGETVLVHS